ncbi:Crp/Fnr family transcriptional regulator [Stappia stellulata]|uniref:Crp/Fnr family transcriptional regulator n=1 Tax=Stappia stellulata TaxID=71235 RepID=UPI00048FA060|nr:Crp/Fnr family transcriptional regulator [Stappia stellulata]
MSDDRASQTECHRCPLRKQSIFRPLDENELNFVSRFKTGELTVDPGSTILLEENKTPHLYTILDGWAFRHKSLVDGRRQILNFAFPGDLLGLQLAILSEMQHTVTALTRTTLCVFQRDKVWSIFKEYPTLAYSMTWMAAREEQMVDGHLLSIGRRNAFERLAYLIIHLYERAKVAGYAGNQTFDAPFTQEHLSDALGITPVHTNRTLKKMQMRKLISWRSERIQILDRSGLEAVAAYEPEGDGQRPLI